MPIGNVREKVLYGIGKKRGSVHRYTIYRWIVGVVFTIAVALLPTLNLFRFDLWGGHHMVLGKEVDLQTAAKAFGYPFMAVNIGIVIASKFVGRYLCGFVCPHGALSRFAEYTRYFGKHAGHRFAGEAVIFVVCMLLGAVTFNFWVDWRVFTQGSLVAKLLSGGFLLGVAGGWYGLLRFLGLGFCRGWCPSGVYFAVLGPDSYNGIEFAHEENCTHCKACEKVCPVDLNPTEMSGGAHREGMGFYSDGLSNFALCLRCGDCVNACEGMTARFDTETPLRMGWLPEGARDSKPPLEDDDDEEAPTPAPATTEASADEERAAAEPAA
ncbi:MAG: 4Fe-4S binding protein [Planctomycetes bacterium]|nr:4Fe-4S binding protein [Planctomycetota bacterium]